MFLINFCFCKALSDLLKICLGLFDIHSYIILKSHYRESRGSASAVELWVRNREKKNLQSRTNIICRWRWTAMIAVITCSAIHSCHRMQQVASGFLRHVFSSMLSTSVWHVGLFFPRTSSSCIFFILFYERFPSSKRSTKARRKKWVLLAELDRRNRHFWTRMAYLWIKSINNKWNLIWPTFCSFSAVVPPIHRYRAAQLQYR